MLLLTKTPYLVAQALLDIKLISTLFKCDCMLHTAAGLHHIVRYNRGKDMRLLCACLSGSVGQRSAEVMEPEKTVSHFAKSLFNSTNYECLFSMAVNVKNI